MPEYKLTYFETTGIVEVIRLILHQSGEKFEDVRVPLEKWNELKKSEFYILHSTVHNT